MNYEHTHQEIIRWRWSRSLVLCAVCHTAACRTTSSQCCLPNYEDKECVVSYHSECQKSNK